MIILSCGHEINSFDDDHFEVILKGETREYDKCLMYKVVCGDCRDEYKINGESFDTEELAYLWLEKEGW